MSYRNFLKSETIFPHGHLGFRALAYPDKHEQNILRVSEVYLEEHVTIMWKLPDQQLSLYSGWKGPLFTT